MSSVPQVEKVSLTSSCTLTPPDQSDLYNTVGTLCGDCREGYGVSFDLRFCQNKCDAGILLFVVICIVTPLLSLAVLYFDFPIPTELKAVIFYAQVNKR